MQEGVISTDNAVIAKKKDGDGVKPFDTVAIFATDKAGFIKAGEKWVVHPVLAEKLIASGKATEKAPKKEKEEKTPE